MRRLLYLILKKDMIKKLSKLHGNEFVDDVMKTFGVPTNSIHDYSKQITFKIEEHNVLIEKLMVEINKKLKSDNILSEVKTMVDEIKEEKQKEIKELHFKIYQLEDKIKQIIPDLN